IQAKAAFRDNTFGSKSRSLKGQGWTRSMDQILAAGVGSVALYATGGLAAAALLSRSVRGAVLAARASKEWPINLARRDLPTIAREVESALETIAPEARAVSVKKDEVERQA